MDSTRTEAACEPAYRVFSCILIKHEYRWCIVIHIERGKTTWQSTKITELVIYRSGHNCNNKSIYREIRSYRYISRKGCCTSKRIHLENKDGERSARFNGMPKIAEWNYFIFTFRCRNLFISSMPYEFKVVLFWFSFNLSL